MYAPMGIERVRVVEQHLEDLLKQRIASHEAPIGDNRLRYAADRTNVRCLDAVAVGLIFFEGFAAVSEGRLKTSELVGQWVKDPGARLRSAGVIANMIALRLCAELDSYVPKIAALGRRESPVFAARCLSLETSLGKDRKLGSALRASAKAWANWPSLPVAAFRIATDAEAIEALGDLVGARTTAAHEQRDHQFSGEHLAMWVSACRWLVDGATRGLDVLLQEMPAKSDGSETAG